MSTTKKGTGTAKRTCSICEKAGHNQRTCPDRKTSPEETELQSAAPKARASSHALALVDSVPTGAHVPHLPLEFEENSKQIHVNGTTLKLTMREYEQGVPNFTVRYQREDKGATDINLDQEGLLKLYELAGWALQRTATTSKALPVRAAAPHVNGVAKSHPTA